MWAPDPEATPEQNRILKGAMLLLEATEGREFTQEEAKRWKKMGRKLRATHPGQYGVEFWCDDWNLMTHGKDFMYMRETPEQREETRRIVNL